MSNSHSPLTALIDMLPSNCCRADFSDMWACVFGELWSLRKNVTLYGFMMGNLSVFIRNSLASMLILSEKFPGCLACPLTICVFQKREFSSGLGSLSCV